ncbi:MAG: DUF5043 domain-containing protein [Mediterranea sp.]|jgi:hypothetical protein|nr:DUF5043 domain-containing protein [Mediterranea sp.]
MKTIITLLVTLCCTTIGMAQTKYYTQTKTFYENGYTYQCDITPGPFVRLYNNSNRFTHTYQTYNGSEKLPPMGVFGRIPFTTNSDTMESIGWSIVYNAFTNVQRRNMVDAKLGVSLYINKETGKVMEVKFDFVIWSPLNTIPIATFRKIETEIKEKLLFIPTAEGKKLNFIFYGWRQPINTKYEQR